MGNMQYFYRNIIFTRKNNQVSLVDINRPDNATHLEEWLGIVVSLADGRHTIQQLIDYMKKNYQQVPVGLEKTLHSVIERLVEGKIIQLSENEVSLPYYLTLPIEELDIEKAKIMIREDGYSSAANTLN
ncbi:MAG: hypothetical protein V7459_03810 [Oceanicoccus sp.]